jgi:hypothetical protein
MYLSSKLDYPLIKTLERIRFSSNQNIGEGESNFDDEHVEKSVQLVRGSSFRNDLLQNPYFKYHHNYIKPDIELDRNSLKNHMPLCKKHYATTFRKWQIAKIFVLVCTVD